MPDWSKGRDLTKNSSWPSKWRLGVGLISHYRNPYKTPITIHAWATERCHGIHDTWM